MLNISKWVSNKRPRQAEHTKILLFGDLNVNNLRYKGKDKYVFCFFRLTTSQIIVLKG